MRSTGNAAYPPSKACTARRIGPAGKRLWTVVCCPGLAHPKASTSALGSTRKAVRRATCAIIGGTLAVPNFGADRPEGVTDFNDLAIVQPFRPDVAAELGALSTADPARLETLRSGVIAVNTIGVMLKRRAAKAGIDRRVNPHGLRYCHGVDRGRAAAARAAKAARACEPGYHVGLCRSPRCGGCDRDWARKVKDDQPAAKHIPNRRLS